MSGRLRRPAVVLAALVLFVVLLVAATRTWARVSLPSPVGGLQTLDVAGSQAAPVVTACALTGLAGAAALSIAGRRTRLLVLAVLAAVALAAAAATAGVRRDAAAAVRTQVAEALAVTPDSVRPGTADVVTTGWVWVALAVALAAVVLSAAGLVAARGWPSGDRFARTPATGVTGPATDAPGAVGRGPQGVAAPQDVAASWDALTAGVDPTDPPDPPVPPAGGAAGDIAAGHIAAGDGTLRGDAAAPGGRMGPAGPTDGRT